MIHSRKLGLKVKLERTTQDAKLIGQKEAMSLGDFPAFSNGIMVATFQTCGQSARWNEALNMESSSWRATGPSDLRNVGGMLSGPAAPFHFIFWITNKSSDMLMEVQLLLSTDRIIRHFLRRQEKAFFEQVGIWCAVAASNDFPYISTISIWHSTV